MAAVKAGALNRRVTIKVRGAGQSAAGQPSRAWVDLATVWANVRHESGAESLRADKEVSIVRASVRIRWRSDVTAAMRVYDGATVYEIKAVLPDAVARDHLDLVCEVVHE